jgi:hypothetical protein
MRPADSADENGHTCFPLLELALDASIGPSLSFPSICALFFTLLCASLIFLGERQPMSSNNFMDAAAPI